MFDWSLPANIGVFAASAVVILLAGTRLSAVADRLADRTGWGEALVGAVLLGCSTSLAGSVVSVTAAWRGQAELAISNGIGGISAQVAMLAIADLAYRRANLEHAAASLANLLFGVLVIILLGGVLLASTGPDWSLFGVHPMSPVLLAGYLYGLRLVQRARTEPMWMPRDTSETRADVPQQGPPEERPSRLWVEFAVLAAALGGCGWLIAETGMQIMRQTALSGTIVGALFTAVATSTPELVTSIAAVKRGALTLAVGGILGGNAFDVLFAVFSDVAYREGSIYHAIPPRVEFLTVLGMVLNAIIVLGMLSRQRRGIGGIGYESVLALVIYAAGVIILTVSG